MGVVLNKNVVTGGVVYPAGTAWTEELDELITNPAHWDGAEDSSADVTDPPDSAKALLREVVEYLVEQHLASPEATVGELLRSAVAVFDDTNPETTKTCPVCGTSWTVDVPVENCPTCQDAREAAAAAANPVPVPPVASQEPAADAGVPPVVAAAPTPLPVVEQVQVQKPAGNGSLEAWQTYARSIGATEEWLAGKSRDDLRKAYPDPTTSGQA